MNRHHRLAAWFISCGVAANLLLGVAFGFAQNIGVWDGLYFAGTTAMTVGYGDITPRGWLPHILAVLIMATGIPLFTITFSLITAGLTADHIDLRHRQVKQHISDTVEGSK